MQTTFALIATFQLHELYGEPADGRWKPKGSDEQVICSDLSLAQVNDLLNSEDGVGEAIDQSGVQINNEYLMMDLIDWRFVELNDSVIDQTYQLIKAEIEWGDNDFMWMVVRGPDYDLSEYQVKWAIEQMEQVTVYGNKHEEKVCLN